MPKCGSDQSLYLCSIYDTFSYEKTNQLFTLLDSKDDLKPTPSGRPINTTQKIFKK